MKKEKENESIKIEREEPLATIWIDRPAKMNALTMAMRKDLERAIKALEKESAIRVLVLKGVGEKAFCAGGDIGEFLDFSPPQLDRLHETVAAPRHCGKPVIAAVKGYCFGVGMEIALACDFIIATEDSLFALPEIRLGMIPGSGGGARIVRRVGIARAKDMILRGRRVSAGEAANWGLITSALPLAEWEKALEQTALDLASLSPLALRMLKETLHDAEENLLPAGLKLEGAAFSLLRKSEDFKEGVNAFLEKRTPDFKGL